MEPSDERPREPIDGYDEVPYTSYPYPRAHPDHLHVIASLFGMQPAPVTRCRVLEIGCGSGGHLLPIAELLPGSELLGLDRSRRQIDRGLELARRAGLRNVQLRHADLMDVDESWGSFDFIVCHGVYSWVPPAAQRRILEIMRDHLRPQGVGYLSYNVYPGWHLREMVRHMMRYHVQQLPEPVARIGQARALLDFLGRHATDAQGAYGAALRKELALLRALPDDYLYHEHLEEENHPLYFHQLAEQLRAHGLQYLGEADPQMMLAHGLDPEARETLERIAPDLLTREQYLDFVRNRQFRATLCCHEGVELVREIQARLAWPLAFEFSGPLGPEPVDLAPSQVHRFVGLGGVEMKTSAPLTKAALVLLRRAWPRAVPLPELWPRVSALLREAAVPGEADQDSLATDLLQCFLSGGIEARSFVPPVATRVTDRPRVSRVARCQAAQGGFAASLHHRLVELDRAQRQLVTRLDGEHDRAQLLAELTELVLSDELQLTLDGRPLRERAEIQAPLEHVVQRALQGMVDRAMLLDDDAGPSAQPGRPSVT
ncbi:MAG: methyltransferase regulatory domain-containing protein [Myxococcales bacterium]|nr:methyltransferase regulatory domain-containing protein [Myxococcales bacterium]